MNDCTEAQCGDGVLHAGVEACDDGNTVDGDGCNATCQLEPGEVEPNDDAMTAQEVAATRLLDASINVAGDENWFEVNVAAGERLTVFTQQGARDQCSVPDTVVAVFDSMGTELARDQGDGPGFCSLVDPSDFGTIVRPDVRTSSGRLK